MSLYGCRAYMNYIDRPTEQWTLNLEYTIEDDLGGASITNTSDDLAAGLAAYLLETVVIDRIVWFTWQPDSEPYNPDNVRTIPYGILGSRDIGGLTSPADDDLVTFMRKTVTTGRAGKVQLRGRILTSDLIAISGSWALNPAVVADFNDDTDALWLAMSNYFAPVLIGVALVETIYPATAEGVKQVPVKVYQEVPSVRAVTDLVLVGPTERQDTQN